MNGLFWCGGIGWILASLIPLSSLAATSPEITTPEEWIQKADQHFAHRGHSVVEAELALSRYSEAFERAETTSDRSKLGWRIGMADYFIGYRQTKDPEAKKKIFMHGLVASQAALKLDPSCAPCAFWAAIDEALWAQQVGPFRTIAKIRDIEELLYRSIASDPTYAGGGAYRLLAQIRLALPSLLGGNQTLAQEYIEKAIKLAPDEPLNYLLHAQISKKQGASADRWIARGAALKRPSDERVESIEAWSELKALQANTSKGLALD